MPSLTSRLFNHQSNHKHSMCCSCSCHHHSLASEETSTIILSPTKWFRRRSSSTSSCSSLFEDHSVSNSSSRRASADYIVEVEDKQIGEFEELYKLAVDEMGYAIESQGSIYYGGDLTTATEAVNDCLDRFQLLMQTLHSKKSHQFQQEWSEMLFELRSRLDSLPFAD